MKRLKYLVIAVAPVLFAAGCEMSLNKEDRAMLEKASAAAADAKTSAAAAVAASKSAADTAQAAADAAKMAAAEAKAAGDKADRIFQKNLRK